MKGKKDNSVKKSIKPYIKNMFSKKNIVGDISKKHIKNGSYSIAVTAIVIAVIVGVNLVAGQIPSQYTQIDISDQKLYTISDETKQILKELNQDVTIYRVVQDGQEDETISKLLQRYEDASSHIQVQDKDPVVNPNFASEYTEESLSSNSLIIVCGERNKVVQYSDMYQQEMDMSTYSYTTSGFDGEGQVTSAIAYVTAENLPVLYNLEGHGEMTLDSEMEESIKKDNIEIQSLNLLTEESVPEDASCIMINSPQNDISDNEKNTIIQYLEAGGKAIIFSDYTTEEMPNFEELLANYGVQKADGVVFEGDNQHYILQMPYYLVPEIQSADITADLVEEGRYVLMPAAQGIQQMENVRDTLEITSLLKTSESAYSKINTDSTVIEQEEGDIAGPFDLGVLITEMVEDEKETQVVYFSSSALLQSQADEMVSGGNTELITSALSYLCKSEESVSIPSKSLQTSYLTITDYDRSFWSVCTIGIIPLGFLLAGFMIWMKRRKA